MEKVNLIVFKDNKTKEIVQGMAFMRCPYCKEQILLDTHKVTFCKNWKCKKQYKVVYKLNRNNNHPEGFDKVLCSKVKDFHKKTLMEVFKNGKCGLL